MPTTVVKTIGTGGGFDYSSIQAWEDAAPANLVTADQIWRGEIGQTSYNETLSSGVGLNIAGSTTDATRYKILTVAAGHSFADNIGSSPLRLNASLGATVTGEAAAYTTMLTVSENNVRIERLQFAHRGATGLSINGSNFLLRGCIVEATTTSTGYQLILNSASVIESCLIVQRSNTSAITMGDSVLLNSTIVVPTGITYTAQLVLRLTYTDPFAKNCAFFAAGQGVLLSARFTYANCYTDASSPPSGVTTVAYNTTTGSGFENIADGTHDYRIKSSSALKETATATGAPATDIRGIARPQGTLFDVGAYELASAPPPTDSGAGSSAGASTATAVGAGVVLSGTITSPPMKNNTGTVLASEAAVVMNVYNQTTGALVVRLTGLTSSVSGVVTGTSGLIVPGVPYAYEIVLASNGRRLPTAVAT